MAIGLFSKQILTVVRGKMLRHRWSCAVREVQEASLAGPSIFVRLLGLSTANGASDGLGYLTTRSYITKTSSPQRSRNGTLINSQHRLDKKLITPSKSYTLSLQHTRIRDYANMSSAATVFDFKPLDSTLPYPSI
jgi:hypothetical protein